MRRLKLFWLVGLGFLWPAWLGAQPVADPFVVTWQDEIRQVQVGDTVAVDVFFQIPPQYFLYKDKTTLQLEEGDGFKQSELKFSPALRKFDRFSQKERDIFEGPTLGTAILQVASDLKAGRYQVPLEVIYQGCSPKICFRQQLKTIQLRFEVSSPTPAPPRGACR